MQVYRNALTSYEELKLYLESIGESFLLEYIQRNEDGYELNKERCKDPSEINPPSVRLQVATVFAMLGEHSIAHDIHQLEWRDLSTFGDKVSNGMLQKFIAPWPRTSA